MSSASAPVLRTLGERNIISVSGGKDSTALWLLAHERGVKHQAVFADTGHEHPATYDYLDYLESKLGKLRRVRADFTADFERKRQYIRDEWPAKGVPADRIERALAALVPTGIPFLDLAMLKGRFPGPMSRFCSAQLKRDVIFGDIFMPMMDAGYSVISWQGIRWDESAHRATYTEREQLAPRLTAYRPILAWSAAEVFAMHDKHGIDPNPLYKQGMGRVGCMPCIHATKPELAEIANRFPVAIDTIEQWEARVSSTALRGSATFFEVEDAGGEFVGQGIRNHVDRSRTTRGGKTYDLTTIGQQPTCASQYGLCE